MGLSRLHVCGMGGNESCYALQHQHRGEGHHWQVPRTGAGVEHTDA